MPKKSKECEDILLKVEELTNKYTAKQITDEFYCETMKRHIKDLKKFKKEMSSSEKANLKFLEVSLSVVASMVKRKNKLMTKF